MPRHDPPASVDQLARAEIDAGDLDVLARIASLYADTDPVPDGLVERLRFGITLDALEAEIARLQRTDPALAGARSDGATEVATVTFTSARLTTMITVTPAGVDRVRIDGWAAPGAGLLVELRIVGDRLHAVADDDGRFVFDDVPRGLAQFLLRPPDEGPDAPPPVITPSLEI
jgi:hypothetical protein